MDGILIVNKPKQYTSHDVVAKVKKICGTKVGHTGTLDPLATGVLPLLLGQGTKLSEFLTNHNKTYEAVLKLGTKTDTADSEGIITQKQEVNTKELTKSKVNQVLQTFVGKQIQVPPVYSAIKVGGKKLYEYAREGKSVEVPSREIEIYNIELLQIQEELKTIFFKVDCSKGTYIRTLCEDIAKRLGTIGYMKELNRVKVGEFTLEQAISIEEIEKNKNNADFWNTHIITIPKFFEHTQSIILPESKLTLFLNGVQLTQNKPDGIYQIQTNQGKWVGMGTVNNKLLKRKLIATNIF